VFRCPLLICVYAFNFLLATVFCFFALTQPTLTPDTVLRAAAKDSLADGLTPALPHRQATHSTGSRHWDRPMATSSAMLHPAGALGMAVGGGTQRFNESLTDYKTVPRVCSAGGNSHAYSRRLAPRALPAAAFDTTGAPPALGSLFVGQEDGALVKGEMAETIAARRAKIRHGKSTTSLTLPTTKPAASEPHSLVIGRMDAQLHGHSHDGPTLCEQPPGRRLLGRLPPTSSLHVEPAPHLTVGTLGHTHVKTRVRGTVARGLALAHALSSHADPGPGALH
jgi:hypothetical protein